MWSRCTNKNNLNYKDYGGRGITVCARWKDFAAFVADLGPRPDGGMIERKNNSKGYHPSNCKWSTRKEQNRNKRNNHMLTINGTTQCVTAWAERVGVTPQTIFKRLKRGWTPQDSVFGIRNHGDDS